MSKKDYEDRGSMTEVEFVERGLLAMLACSPVCEVVPVKYYAIAHLRKMYHDIRSQQREGE